MTVPHEWATQVRAILREAVSNAPHTKSRAELDAGADEVFDFLIGRIKEERAKMGLEGHDRA